jgi:HTH-type transcriptional regulator / antitoxin HigA
MSTDAGSVQAASELPGQFAPDWAVSPGDVLRAELEGRQMTQADLASRTGLSTKHVNQVIKAIVPLSPDTAQRLELALSIPSHLWNALEAAHQDRLTHQRTRAQLVDYVPWLRRFPVAELVKRRVLAAGDKLSQVEQLLRFFGVANPAAYEKVWAGPLTLGFRRAQKHQVDPYATAAWVRLGEIAAQNIETKPFDERGLRGLFPELRPLTRLPDQQAFAQLQTLLANVGIAVVFVREIGGSRAHGATRWLAPDRALIILSSRYQWADTFWFSFFHELAHILLHPRRMTFVDLAGGDDGDGHESEADAFAAATLLPRISVEEIKQLSTKSEMAQVAKTASVDPGIVAGAYGHLTNNWSRFARFRHKFDLEGKR